MVIPHPVDNGGMMEIHVRYHANNESETNFVQTKARQMQNTQNLDFVLNVISKRQKHIRD